MNAGRREFATFFAFAILLHVAVLTAVQRPPGVRPALRDNTVLFRFDSFAPRSTAPSTEASAPRPAPALTAASAASGGQPALAKSGALAPVVEKSQVAAAEKRATVEPSVDPARESTPLDAAPLPPETETRTADENRKERISSLPQNSSSSTTDESTDVAAAEVEFSQVRATYEQALSAWLDRHKYYPAPLRRRRLQGDGEMRIRIDRNGTVLYAAMNKSLPNGMLDEVALDWANRANPFPTVPESISGDSYEFLVPVEFTIR